MPIRPTNDTLWLWTRYEASKSQQVSCIASKGVEPLTMIEYLPHINENATVLECLTRAQDITGI